MVQIFKQTAGSNEIPRLWDDCPSVEDAKIGIRIYIDIHESDGDLPSIWTIVEAGTVVHTVDASKMLSDERLSCDEIRGEGRQIFEEDHPELAAAKKEVGRTQ